MFDLLTKEEDAVAAAQGWGVHPVYDLETAKWRVMALPHGAAEVIVSQVRLNNPLHTKALRLIQAGYEKKTK